VSISEKTLDSDDNAGLAASALSHLVVEVNDLSAADFYRDILGFAEAGRDMIEGGASVALAAAAGGFVILVENKDRPDLTETGVHQAYGVSRARRAMITEALAARGTAVATYHEDRPAEETDNCYFSDPAGNRIQLVVRDDAGDVPVIDHAAVQVANMWWAERFYTQTLGCAVDLRVGWKTADYARAQLWADGKEDMAPGTRRMDKRYSSMVNRSEVPRVNLQVYLKIGAAPFALYLANRHFQEPPEERLRGTPRSGFAVSAGMQDQACRILDGANWPWERDEQNSGGPFARSLFFKDPGGNFIELAVRNGE
jgi:catechol-2,3-dioxygenase